MSWNTDPLDCGSAPAAPCVGGAGCGQLWPPSPPPSLVLATPSRRAGGQWAEKGKSEECPAEKRADDSHRLGVPTRPAKRGRRHDWRTEEEKLRVVGHRTYVDILTVLASPGAGSPRVMLGREGDVYRDNWLSELSRAASRWSSEAWTRRTTEQHWSWTGISPE